MAFTFGKKEKLKSRKQITQLFDEGATATKFPVKVFYLPAENAEASQVTFAVPKRNFKTAVLRNRIKRQLREAYRLKKGSFNSGAETKFALLFLYLGKEKPNYAQLEKSFDVLLNKVRL